MLSTQIAHLSRRSGILFQNRLFDPLLLPHIRIQLLVNALMPLPVGYDHIRAPEQKIQDGSHNGNAQDQDAPRQLIRRIVPLPYHMDHQHQSDERHADGDFHIIISQEKYSRDNPRHLQNDHYGYPDHTAGQKFQNPSHVFPLPCILSVCHTQYFIQNPFRHLVFAHFRQLHLPVPGQNRDHVVSVPKPAPSTFTLLATIISRFFFSSFFTEFSIICSVSMEKPHKN